ncbi:MAG: serine hydrolase [Synechococcaceae cyanobacterium]|nr:serine hydrolase [Synechococcaceae cyanobacterium]
MAFYSHDPGMGQRLVDLVRALELEGRPGLSQQLSITWLRYSEPLGQRLERVGREPQPPLQPRGASWEGRRLHYPASVVKLVYLVAAEAWLQQGLLEDGAELRRALADMIRDSSNDATGLVVDLLSGTSSGPDLPPDRLEAWASQRQLVNAWLQQLRWPELEGCNACQKTWGDGPYGRERQFYGEDLGNRNRLSSEATARMLQAVLAGELLSPPACLRMAGLLARSLDPQQRAADPENQVDGFVGGGLPLEARLWSKAGWMSQARHDAAYVEADGADPFLLVIYASGSLNARDENLLPYLAGQLLQACRR